MVIQTRKPGLLFWKISRKVAIFKKKKLKMLQLKSNTTEDLVF